MTRKNRYKWNLNLLYTSLNDPKIEQDILNIETLHNSFAEKYNIENKTYLNDNDQLLQVLDDYEVLMDNNSSKPSLYLNYVIHTDSVNNKALSLSNLLDNRMTKAQNKITFFELSLAGINKDRQNDILNNKMFSKYKFFLYCIFDDSLYNLTEAEEKILNLKALPASDMWNMSHDRILSAVMIEWKGKRIPLAEANNLISGLKRIDRLELSKKISIELKKVSIFSEAEINAVVTNKKINDELRNYRTPFENTVRRYRNDPVIIEKLIKTVSDNFHISHKFFRLKTKILNLKSLRYSDRNAKIGEIKGEFSFDSSKMILEKAFASFDNKYAEILNSFVKNGQIDIYPRKGKKGGAYCSSSLHNPTFVLLNHSDNINSYTTFAHEMGHAFHSELSKSQGPLYSSYSTSLAETASTFFESLAFDEILKTLSKKQKIIALHNKINSDISTIFRQIACFNFENDIHNIVRKNGFISKEELADLHNKHMKAYLGPIFKMEHDDGYFFVQWSHIRRFFYVYTYAYGMLVSKSLLKRYRENKNFIVSIEKFLSSGGKNTPENILKEIGVDMASGQIFQDGIDEIARDIKELERLMRSSD
ncbi:MAG: M3 family oligoendopeptidase [Patescibacteria group bacterium]